MKYYDIEDPQGFTHRVLVEKNEVFGAENLAHGYPDHERKYVIQRVMQAVVGNKPLPDGFKLKDQP